MNKQVIHNPIAPMKRIVLKVGSALLVDDEKAAVRKKWLVGLASDIQELSKQGKQVIIVSSGAIALGRKILGYEMEELKLDQRQAAAACGQILLMQAWQDALKECGLKTAQALITQDDTEMRERFLNARHTIELLLEAGIVPIVNENDVVTPEGVRVGDNDRLAARVAQMVSAGLLILLSDVDGLYTADPTENENAEHIPLVPEITEKVEAMAGNARSHKSSGGMKTKIEAAKIATASGCHMLICEGSIAKPLNQISKQAKYTLFLGQETPLSARKEWIVGTLDPKGTLIIDSGAAKALSSGSSLLPAGVKQVEGTFARGDAVWISDENGKRVAKGLSSYNSEDTNNIQGKHSDQIVKILGYKARDVLVHRDDMVML